MKLARAAQVVATAPLYAATWLLGLLWKAGRVCAAVARQGFEDGSR